MSKPIEFVCTNDPGVPGKWVYGPRGCVNFCLRGLRGHLWDIPGKFSKLIFIVSKTKPAGRDWIEFRHDGDEEITTVDTPMPFDFREDEIVDLLKRRGINHWWAKLEYEE